MFRLFIPMCWGAAVPFAVSRKIREPKKPPAFAGFIA
jgi:hypothetical protein